MTTNIAIIGGGIIGLCSAYYLQKEGYQVTVFESNEVGKGSSYGNAGLIVPSLYEPLSSPSLRKQGLRWMLSPNSPFYLKPRLSWDLLYWLFQFNQSCTKKHCERSKPLLRDLHLYSLNLYHCLQKDIDFQYKQTGVLFIYQTLKYFAEVEILINEAKQLGLSANLMTQDDIAKKEPNLSLNTVGGIFYEQDAKVQPFELVRSLRQYIEERGAIINENCPIQSLQRQGKKVTALVGYDKRRYPIDEVVIAAGVYSPQLAKQLQINIPLQAGKGFSFIANKSTELEFSTPLMLMEDKVAVTPYDNYVRFAGTMIFCGNDLRIDKQRVDNMRKAVNRVFNHVELTEENTRDVWAGLRPCTPDGLPAIGRSDIYENVIVATGHAMLGISLGAVTGRIVCDVVTGKSSEVERGAIDISRFK